MNRSDLFIISVVFVSVMMVGFGGFAQESTTQEEPLETPKLHLNFAELEKLQELPDVTPEIAQTIFENRPYASFVDLLELEGITEDWLVSIEEIAEVRLLNINSATVAELQMLPGITAEVAESIVAERPYEIIEELYQISGIGEEEFKQLQGFIEAQPAENDDAGDKGWKLRKKNPLLLPGTQP